MRTTFDALWPGLSARLLTVAREGREPRRPVLVGVDGRSGSGKTDLAAGLAEAVRELGLGCAVVHLDDLYPGWSGLAASLTPLCADVVAPLTRGQDGAYLSWDWDASRPGPRRRVPARRVVVLEGVGVLAAPCAADLDLRVWLEAPASVRQARALDRDGDVFAPHWQEWSDQEDALFAAGNPPADVVADTVTSTVRWATLGP
ncbi:para-aminobenzoate synthase [Ornithinimicrobium pekingense]|uniref:Adenylate kinase n=1 Tax=Ornithinimicrobium pekingense TaxID=384677 RepID=A0ABQ2FA64_9MICO|nr:para-aminobenzoate synthase [Ornithinimicrobium pekingense]GGK74397.1 adenylate kinase [Ornithinimicrobium pekingense]